MTDRQSGGSESIGKSREFAPITITCSQCRYTLEILHRIVPPENMRQDQLQIPKIPGCKNREQEIFCPQCGGNSFERL